MLKMRTIGMVAALACFVTGCIGTSIGPAGGIIRFVPRVTPKGSSAADVFTELAHRGLDVVVDVNDTMSMQDISGFNRFINVIVPVEWRFLPADGRAVVEAVAACQGMKVAWMQGRRGEFAFLYWQQPDSELKRFAKELNSPDAAVRLEAVEKAGWMKDVRVLPALVTAASGPDEKVAKGVMNNLCRRPWAPILATESVREAAWKLAEQELSSCGTGAFGSDRARGCRLLEGMTVFGGERALANVRKTLERDDPMARRFGLECLCRLTRERALPDVEKGLKDDDPRVRETALEMLGWIEGGKSVARLEKSLDDEDAIVRRGAVAGLGWVGGEKAASLIGQKLNDTDEAVRKTVVIALKRVGGDAANDLLEYASLDRTQSVAWPAWVGAIDLLEKALLDRAQSVSWPAARAWAGLQGKKVVPVLEKRLAVGDAAARQRALVSLGEIGSRKAVDFLEAASTNADPDIRVAAAKGLGKVGDDRSLDILRKMVAEEKDAKLRVAMVRSVPCCRKSIPLVQEFSKDPDPALRLTVEYASCKMDGQIADIWIKATKDPDGRVRQLAANASGGMIGFDRYRQAREALLAAVETELDPGALDEQLTCLGSYREKARDILVKRMQGEKDFEKVKAIGRGARRILGNDPQIAKLLKDLNVPPGTAWDK